MDAFRQDLRLALRSLAKNPAFTLVVVLTLALGIGANAAIFSVINGVVLQPLPFSSPGELVRLYESNASRGFNRFSVSPPNFMDWQAQSQVLQDVAAYNQTNPALTGLAEAEQLEGLSVTGSFFNVLAAKPELGRVITGDDAAPGQGKVAVLSHGLWQRRFGGRSDMIGQSIKLDGENYQVIGVMPASFRYPLRGADLWVPLMFGPDVARQRGAHYLDVVGRLKAGASVEQLQAEMTRLGSVLQEQYPRSNTGWTVRALSLQEAVVGDIRPALLMLLGAVGLVVLIACANVASLLLARAVVREAEVAIRAALGASRVRILRLLLTESLVLALLGGAAGIGCAVWGVDLLMRFGPDTIPRFHDIRVDGTVLLYTLALSLTVGVIFGLAPAIHSSRADLRNALATDGRGTAGRARQRTRSLLVVAEMGLALMLLAGAGLLIKSFVGLRQKNPGFDASRVLTLGFSLPEASYPDGARVSGFVAQALERVRALPGVESAGAIWALPLVGFNFSSSFSIDGAPEPEGDESQSAQVRVASPDYFKTLRIPLKQGRMFTDADRRGAARVVLASEAAVRRFWPHGDAIGHHVRLDARSGPDRVEGEIVGIVGDVHDQSLAEEPDPTFYGPFDQVGADVVTIVARASGTPASLAAAASDEIRRLDGSLPIVHVTTMESVVAESLGGPRFYALMLGVFAAVAMVLAAVGVSGIVAYSVSQRRREIGIRRALGAEERQIVWMILARSGALTLAGLALGLAGSIGVTRVLARLLVGVSPTDPTVLIGVALILAAVAFLASYLPARGAGKVDPIVVLRSE